MISVAYRRYSIVPLPISYAEERTAEGRPYYASPAAITAASFSGF
jgi:hypothetical protein